MSYFKFELPEGKGYSPNWCGSCFVPKNPKVLAYNEPEGFGIACCDTPKEDLDLNLTVLSEEEALSLVAEASKQKGSAGVFVEETLTDKWLAEPVRIEALPTVDPETGEEEQPAEPDLIDNIAKFCPVCHRLAGVQLVYSNGSNDLIVGKSPIRGIPIGQVITVPCLGHNAKITITGTAVKAVTPTEAEVVTAKFCPDCFELLTLTGKETADSEVEELLAESANEEYSNPEYRVLTCPNGHRVKEVLNGVR